MKFVYALAALSVLALSPPAMARDATMQDCSQLAKQVRAALETATPGEATSEARTAADAGRNMCSYRLYAMGVARYNKALKLLGKS